MITPNTKKIYNNLDDVWPKNNSWYKYTHDTIYSYVRKEMSTLQISSPIVLNAGSGGSNYDLNIDMYHLDIASNLICDLPNKIIASVEQIPCDDNFFDVIICVGSVINYCSALEAITEMARVLKPNGKIILEYERSNSAELWGTKEYGKKATYQSYCYLNDIHNLWLYSEKYINELLHHSGLQINKLRRFHSFSAMMNRFMQNEQMAGRYSKYDFCMRPFSYYMAHNCILTLEKISFC